MSSSLRTKRKRGQQDASNPTIEENSKKELKSDLQVEPLSEKIEDKEVESSDKISELKKSEDEKQEEVEKSKEEKPEEVEKSQEKLEEKQEDGWRWHETIMYWESQNIIHSSKIASFDFDGCLAKTSLFKKGPDAWSILFPQIPHKLKTLHEAGYKLVIFTNQSDIGKAAKPETRAKAIKEKQGRLIGFVKKVDLPFQIFVATSKTTVTDAHRKPAIGMWTFMEEKCNGGQVVDKQQSFFVGDAAGRKSDHGDSDLLFARKLSLQFHTEVYFTS